MVGTYFRHRRVLDPLIAGIAVAAVQLGSDFGLGFFRPITDETAFSIFEGMFQAGATMLGFVLASVTFLAAHVRQPEFKILRESRSYPDLLAVFRSALWRLFVLTAFAALGTVLDEALLIFAERGLLFIALYAALAVASLIWITIGVIRVPART